MEATSHSLLERAGRGTADAWFRLDRIYRPFLLSWFTAHGVDSPDAEDLTQEVLLVVSRQIGAFAHNGRTGAFRTWLREMCLNRLLGHRRAQRLRGQPVGGTEFQDRLGDLQDSAADLSGDWDREHDLAILRQALENVANQFEEATLRAFRRLALDGARAQQVAAEQQMSIGAVYIAKSRVLRRLRSEAAGLVDGSVGHVSIH